MKVPLNLNKSTIAMKQTSVLYSMFCIGMLNDNRKIDYRILLSESLSRFNNRLSKTNDLPTGDLEIYSASAKAGARLAVDVSAR